MPSEGQLGGEEGRTGWRDRPREGSDGARQPAAESAPFPIRQTEAGSEPSAGDRDRAVGSSQGGEVESPDTARERFAADAAVGSAAHNQPQRRHRTLEESAGMREPSPSVRITIGRVEVRALFTAASPPARTPVRRPPSITLEDYLRSRKGGQR